MKSWIIGVLFVLIIVAGGIIYSSGFAAKNGVPDGQGAGIAQDTEAQNVMSTTFDSLETAPSADEKVSASALACTIKNEGDYVVDLRLNNPGKETRTITIDPSGTKVDLLPDQTKRFDLHLGNEVSMLTLLVDDGTELQVQSPTCTASGSSGSSGRGSSLSTTPKQESSPLPPNKEIIPTPPNKEISPTPPNMSPPPPVPELSPLVLTIAGISGLLLVSRIRKN
ncbi:MAG: hypothetical protein C3F06_01410 [Candidatus Methanoperedenaceae archaeon]|nr:MAG: hypothetical protein C3F06_01410 [Candidatus Methanoperedenaceae archaeon]